MLTVLAGFYCMPEEGIELSPASHILSDDEIIRLATLFVQQGVNKIRLTGGEPTVRKSLPEIICACHVQVTRNTLTRRSATW